MIRTTPGELLINRALPEDLRRPGRVLDSAGIKELFEELAEKHPDRYRDVSSRLVRLAADFAYEKGGLSFGVRHLRPARAALLRRMQIRRGIDAILDDRGVDDATREKKILDLLESHRAPLEKEVFDESLAEDNPLARQVVSGVRGNKTNLRSLRGMDLTYVDHRDRAIPIPILKSYSEGLSPAEYWAGAYGARRGVLDVKQATQDAGFMSKTLVAAAHKLIATARDSDEPDETASLRGMPTDVSDPDNVGALIARPVGGYPRNTVITPRVLKDLQDKGVTRMLVRSPIVGGPAGGGLYSRDAGVREKGKLPPIGDYVGHAAVQAASEKLTQGALSSKHSGGVAGAGGAVSGFKAVERLVNPPKVFPGAASHAQVDGRVTAVEDAPQGGRYVWIGPERHYVPAGLAATAKVGDDVEAGDVLSEGMPNPTEIVRHKGVGEGRRYFVDAMRDVYKRSGMSAHRRNIEILARGLVDHVTMDAEAGDWVPGDVVPYSTIEAGWTPRPEAAASAPRAAIGRYLEKPVLHYTIGTKVRPSVARSLEEFGVGDVLAHRDPPPFSPTMIRGVAQSQHDPDWAARQLGSGATKATLEAARRGAVADAAGPSFVAPLSLAPETWNRAGKTVGWDPKEASAACVLDDLLDADLFGLED